jgi:hypothetical protein
VGIFNITWEDLWAYDKCPRKLAVDTRIASLRGPYFYPPKHENTEDLFANAETTVRETFALRTTERQNAVSTATVPKERLQDYAKYFVQQSVKPTKPVLEALTRNYGDIQTIGKVEVRQPDMVSRAHPDFFALTSSGKRLIVEEKSTPSEEHKFKARFYNGLTESHGVFVVEERWENGVPALVPHVVREPVETLLVYPDSEEIIEEKFLVSIERVKNAALAKQLGYQGECPVESCGPNCKHNHLSLRLSKTESGPLRPLGLAFCELLQQENFNFDYHYQTFYKWHLEAGLREFFQNELLELTQLNEWLKEAACLYACVVDELCNGLYDVSAKTILKKTGREGDLWRRVLHVTFNARVTQSVLGNGRGVFALPQGSELFLKGAVQRWSHG